MSMSSIRCRRLLFLAALALLVVSCGTTVSDNVDSLGDNVDSGAPLPVDLPVNAAVEPIRVRVIGELLNGTICPGGQRPCLPLYGDTRGLDGVVQLTGSITQNVVEIESIEQYKPYSILFEFADRCEGKRPGSGDFELIQTVNAYTESIPDDYATLWSSPTQVFHLGVVGDPAPHEQAMIDLGLADRVCVVGGFARSDAELEVVQNELSEVVVDWHERPDVGLGGWSRNAFRGAVEVGLYRADQGMRNAVVDRFGDLVVLDAAVEVLNSSLEDFDTRFGPDGPPPVEPQLHMVCGAVRFDGDSFDFDTFPAADADLVALLVEGFGRGGGFGDIENTKWVIASSDATSIGVVGRQDTDPPSYLDAIVTGSGDAQRMTSWGGCRLEVAALGLRGAETVLDPDKEPGPEANTLSVLITERSCAGGQPPAGREVIPVITETDTEVHIVVLVAPVRGGATCPGNPQYPVEVQLDQPLGDRIIRDARTIPPERRTWSANPETVGKVAGANTIDEILAATDYTTEDAETLRLYRAFLNREPDVDGAKYWIAVRRDGASLDDLAYGFAVSVEFTSEYGTLDNSAFLTVLYENMLGRTPDPEGFAYWLDLMDTGELTQHGVARWVVANAEFVSRYPYAPTRS